jgi:hypothetical protein
MTATGSYSVKKYHIDSPAVWFLTWLVSDLLYLSHRSSDSAQRLFVFQMVMASSLSLFDLFLGFKACPFILCPSHSRVHNGWFATALCASSRFTGPLVIFKDASLLLLLHVFPQSFEHA